MGQKISKNLIQAMNKKAGKVAERLNKLMEESRAVLERHPVNKKRVMEGKDPANMVWVWGGGKKLNVPLFKEKYGVLQAHSYPRLICFVG